MLAAGGRAPCSGNSCRSIFAGLTTDCSDDPEHFSRPFTRIDRNWFWAHGPDLGLETSEARKAGRKTMPRIIGFDRSCNAYLVGLQHAARAVRARLLRAQTDGSLAKRLTTNLHGTATLLTVTASNQRLEACAELQLAAHSNSDEVTNRPSSGRKRRGGPGRDTERNGNWNHPSDH